MASATQRIIILKVFFFNRITQASQNSSKKFIILLAYINVFKIVLPSAFIY